MGAESVVISPDIKAGEAAERPAPQPGDKELKAEIINAHRQGFTERRADERNPTRVGREAAYLGAQVALPDQDALKVRQSRGRGEKVKKEQYLKKKSNGA